MNPHTAARTNEVGSIAVDEMEGCLLFLLNNILFGSSEDTIRCCCVRYSYLCCLPGCLLFFRCLICLINNTVHNSSPDIARNISIRFYNNILLVGFNRDTGRKFRKPIWITLSTRFIYRISKMIRLCCIVLINLVYEGLFQLSDIFIRKNRSPILYDIEVSTGSVLVAESDFSKSVLSKSRTAASTFRILNSGNIRIVLRMWFAAVSGNICCFSNSISSGRKAIDLYPICVIVHLGDRSGIGTYCDSACGACAYSIHKLLVGKGANRSSSPLYSKGKFLCYFCFFFCCKICVIKSLSNLQRSSFPCIGIGKINHRRVAHGRIANFCFSCCARRSACRRSPCFHSLTLVIDSILLDKICSCVVIVRHILVGFNNIIVAKLKVGESICTVTKLWVLDLFYLCICCRIRCIPEFLIQSERHLIFLSSSNVIRIKMLLNCKFTAHIIDVLETYWMVFVIIQDSRFSWRVIVITRFTITATVDTYGGGSGKSGKFHTRLRNRILNTTRKPQDRNLSGDISVSISMSARKVFKCKIFNKVISSIFLSRIYSRNILSCAAFLDLLNIVIITWGSLYKVNSISPSILDSKCNSFNAVPRKVRSSCFIYVLGDLKRSILLIIVVRYGNSFTSAVYDYRLCHCYRFGICSYPIYSRIPCKSGDFSSYSLSNDIGSFRKIFNCLRTSLVKTIICKLCYSLRIFSVSCNSKFDARSLVCCKLRRIQITCDHFGHNNITYFFKVVVGDSSRVNATFRRSNVCFNRIINSRPMIIAALIVVSGNLRCCGFLNRIWAGFYAFNDKSILACLYSRQNVLVGKINIIRLTINNMARLIPEPVMVRIGWIGFRRTLYLYSENCSFLETCIGINKSFNFRRRKNLIDFYRCGIIDIDIAISGDRNCISIFRQFTIDIHIEMHIRHFGNSHELINISTDGVIRCIKGRIIKRELKLIIIHDAGVSDLVDPHTLSISMTFREEMSLNRIDFTHLPINIWRQIHCQIMKRNIIISEIIRKPELYAARWAVFFKNIMNMNGIAGFAVHTYIMSIFIFDLNNHFIFIHKIEQLIRINAARITSH